MVQCVYNGVCGEHSWPGGGEHYWVVQSPDHSVTSPHQSPHCSPLVTLSPVTTTHTDRVDYLVLLLLPDPVQLPPPLLFLVSCSHCSALLSPLTQGLSEAAAVQLGELSSSTVHHNQGQYHTPCRHPYHTQNLRTHPTPWEIG